MSEHGEKFGAALACIDGRTESLSDYVKQTYGLRWVDRINRPGMDALLGTRTPWWNLLRRISIWLVKRELFISVHHHGSRIIPVSGHLECAGNPVSEEEHRTHIKRACEVVRGWNLPSDVKVVGLLVHNKTGVWKVEEVL